MKPMSGSEIRRSFIQFFEEMGHTAVPSASLVPGGDQTLLFTNAGMVQFKEVFLGTDTRPYKRAVDSQKCMRVAGKHNDLDDVGRDDSHHTFFEMLGNWSFGDYYKKEAITWAWQLLTDVWGLDKSKLWVTVFKDEKGEIPADDEAASYWKQQPGLNPDHILAFGRKANFWEMADTGPCGPCSEIHIDRGPKFCEKQGVPGHVCAVNGDCARYLELWNLVFIQYNRLSPTRLEPLPARHVDTGMGFERIVAVIQDVSSNYKTDLLFPLVEVVRAMTGHTLAQMEADFTPYRVIADHSRAAAFLIADGVVPGNVGRNYVCRMILRRAARFGRKLGLYQPFMAKVAERMIEGYGDAYAELVRHKRTILDNITREEERFTRTVDAGMAQLEDLLAELKQSGGIVLDGHKAFELYATLGLPLELARDVAREQGLDVDEVGFKEAMEEHRVNSGAGKAFGALGGEDVDVYRPVFERLVKSGGLHSTGVQYDPYSTISNNGKLLAIFRNGESVTVSDVGDKVELLVPRTNFYVESGGQVADHGWIRSVDGKWEVRIDDIRRPAAGILVHLGEVTKGQPTVEDQVIVEVDRNRRQDIRRNHTATHLLHAALHQVLGEHARQAGSLVAPDKLRFDFTHPQAMSKDELERVEEIVNHAILNNHALHMREKPLQEAMQEGAMALFGEKYGEVVRTITIGDEGVISYELCGGTHVDHTGDIGLFIITSEGSAAAGVRRIEAVTGRAAYHLVQKRLKDLKRISLALDCSIEDVEDRINVMLDDLQKTKREVSGLKQKTIRESFDAVLAATPMVNGVPVLTAVLPEASADTLRDMTDKFRQKHHSGIVVLGSVVDDKPVLIAAVTDDLVKRGLHAGDIVKTASAVMDGSGGGRPNLAQAGGKNPAKLQDALDLAQRLIVEKLQ
jgi:alanyl-tRNA synthetase